MALLRKCQRLLGLPGALFLVLLLWPRLQLPISPAGFNPLHLPIVLAVVAGLSLVFHLVQFGTAVATVAAWSALSFTIEPSLQPALSWVNATTVALLAGVRLLPERSDTRGVATVPAVLLVLVAASAVATVSQLLHSHAAEVQETAFGWVSLVQAAAVPLPATWPWSQEQTLATSGLIVALAWLPGLRRHSTRPTVWFVLAALYEFWRLEHVAISHSLAPELLLALIATCALLIAIHGLAFVDELTGTASRRALDDALRTPPRRYAVALVDIDHFKKINDRHGHDAGDDVLRSVASQLQRIRGAELYRYGGEEFVLLFRGRSKEQALARVDQARKLLAGRSFVLRQTKRRKKGGSGRFGRNRSSRATAKKLRVRFSAGIADQRSGSPADALKRADQALYRAKRAGRNRVVAATA